MVRLSKMQSNICAQSHLGGGYLSNPTIKKFNKHERILENNYSKICFRVFLLSCQSVKKLYIRFE